MGFVLLSGPITHEIYCGAVSVEVDAVLQDMVPVLVLRSALTCPVSYLNTLDTCEFRRLCPFLKLKIVIWSALEQAVHLLYLSCCESNRPLRYFFLSDLT
ncbi:hypothetical protein ElyMa_003679200 [Elysia marginata]|uniref:Uncharacterized protein n=1 Tax=Elysia marginata TaxID=1093978 RepID=A0AAV4F0F7_9GAST|nr:hypothetical protein ElyMa_003679200 [Elysia marginata]